MDNLKLTAALLLCLICNVAIASGAHSVHAFIPLDVVHQARSSARLTLPELAWSTAQSYFGASYGQNLSVVVQQRGCMSTVLAMPPMLTPVGG